MITLTILVVVAAFALYTNGMNKVALEQQTELEEELWPYI